MRMLHRLDSAGVLVLDGVAHAPQQTHPWVSGVGEDYLPGHAHADHLVVDDVRRHAQERQLLETLPDGLVPGSMRNEVRESLEGDGVAAVKVSPDRLGKAQELRHGSARIRNNRQLQASKPLRWK